MLGLRHNVNLLVDYDAHLQQRRWDELDTTNSKGRIWNPSRRVS